MKARLHPCPRCERHVRASEAACPFCTTRLGARSWLGAALATGLTTTAAVGLGGDAVSVAHAQVDDEAVRLTPQYGAPSDPYPPPPPPPRDEPDAGKPAPSGGEGGSSSSPGG